MNLNHLALMAVVVPISTRLGVLDGITAITRIWLEGDSAECRLCEHCVAKDDVCMVMTTDRVSAAEAPSYDLRDVHVEPLRAGLDHDTLRAPAPGRRADREQGKA